VGDGDPIGDDRFSITLQPLGQDFALMADFGQSIGQIIKLVVIADTLITEMMGVIGQNIWVYFEDRSMSIPAVTLQLLAAKRAKGMSFADLEKLLDRDEVWIAALFYRQATASPEEAEKLAQALDLDAAVAAELTQYPVKGTDIIVPTDPLIYRFYEIMQVYGMAIKDVIQEKFGDGIMSAIDFTLDIEKEPDPKGDRVKLIMNGKFLPYKKW
jgi:cyanate lyase